MNEELSPVGRYQNILLATDGSEYSAAAEDAALELSLRCDARLLVTTIVLTNPEYEALVPDRVEQAESDAQTHIDRLAERARGRGVKAETLLRHGSDPYHEVVRAANERNADVIVVGRRTRSDLVRLLVGDSTAKTIGLASCSVLVVPRGARMPESRVLVATDGSRIGDAAAFSAVRLAEICGLPLTALSVVGPQDDPDRRTEAMAAIERVQAEARARGVNAEGLVEEGPRPEERIVERAGASGADIVVVGSHGRTGLSRLLLGSVSERVIGTATFPVLVVKASL